MKGNPTNHPSIRLCLSDFTYEELVQNEMGDEDAVLCIFEIELFQFLAAAEKKARYIPLPGKHSVASGVRKRRRSETSPEEIRSDGDTRYIEQEVKAAKCTTNHDDGCHP
jgi:hypothetical protein